MSNLTTREKVLVNSLTTLVLIPLLALAALIGFLVFTFFSWIGGPIVGGFALALFLFCPWGRSKKGK